MPSDHPPSPQCLSPEDFDAQDDVLDGLREHDDEIPQWEVCEGFLAALVCCRRLIEPQAYWPVQLGETFVPMAHMAFVMRWRRRWVEVAAALDTDVQNLDDERCYQPELLDTLGALLALPADERGDVDLAKVPAFAQVWALGFMYAVENWPDDWRPPRDPEAAQMLDDALERVVALTENDTGKPVLSMHSEDGPPSISQQRLDAYGEAIWSVYDLRQLWQSLGPRTEPQRKPDTPGRNDPCPCGSGKKYKKCHGSA